MSNQITPRPSCSSFNPLAVCSMVRDVLRKFFQEFGDSFEGGYRWDPDEKKSKITIGTVNDLNRRGPPADIPRVLIGRGTISSGVQFISNSLEAKEMIRPGEFETAGRQDIQGDLQIIIESNHEGSCEIIGETIRRYLTWTRLDIEREFGFQRFANQINISDCQLDREDKEKFKIQLVIPYRIEDRWRVTEFHVKLKQAFLEVTAN